MRHLMNLLLVVLLVVIVVWLEGCGAGGGLGISGSADTSGGGSLTGGSIPIGGDVDGRVYQAQGLTTVAGVPVQVVGASGNVQSTQVTGADGSFSFTKIPQGNWNLQVTQGTQVTNVPVALDSNPVSVSLVVDSAPIQIRQLQLQPAGTLVSLTTGETLAFQASGIDASGVTHPLAASWLLHGHVGTLSPSGVFSAMQSGTGTLIASYQHLSTSVQITVK